MRDAFARSRGRVRWIDAPVDTCFGLTGLRVHTEDGLKGLSETSLSYLYRKSRKWRSLMEGRATPEAIRACDFVIASTGRETTRRKER